MVLQKDVAEIMNKSSITSTAEKLKREGKIKRQKVRARMKNGNLNDMWLLYVPSTNPNDILDYEKELVNRPFSSPLKEHHFYKRDKDVPAVVESGITQTTNNNNVVQMQDYVRVNDYDIAVKEYNNQRVVTTHDIAKAHQKEVKHVNEQMRRHQRHLIENEDYFVITRENSSVAFCDLEKYFTNNRQKEVYVFTKTGYMMLVKVFSDNLSWTVQRELVNTYFKMKELKQDQSLVNVQQVQNVQMIDFMEVMVKEFKNQNNRITNLEDKFNNIVNILAK